MSNSLVQKSLEILGYEKDQKKKKKKHKDVKYKGVLDLIPMKHRVIKTYKTESDITLNRSNKNTVYKTQKQINAQQDPVNENVQRFLFLSDNRINPETASNLLLHAIKKKCIVKQEKPKKPEETVFTEEDFKNFENLNW